SARCARTLRAGCRWPSPPGPWRGRWSGRRAARCAGPGSGHRWRRPPAATGGWWRAADSARWGRPSAPGRAPPRDTGRRCPGRARRAGGAALGSNWPGWRLRSCRSAFSVNRLALSAERAGAAARTLDRPDQQQSAAPRMAPEQEAACMTPTPATHQARSAHTRAVVMARGDELRRRLPILRHQDAIGAGILAFALAGMLGSAWLYAEGAIAWWACLLANAFFASLTHELEHDLIHSMYFRKQRVPHNLMMGLVWMARPSTNNPWIRRHLHLNHHKVSGTETDIEERAITNGEPWGFARLLMVGDNVMS